ncbi:MAG: hypothetical protein E7282_08455 [Lachnospiraceae bacterium]|nr:hypothetical protein [Lachnospiraceae bacterium]
MRRYFLAKTIAIGICISSILSLVACSPANVISSIENRFIDEKEAHENPLFWDDSEAVSGSKNLYKISGENFEHKPYIEMHRFGDHILLIGQAAYGNSNSNPEDFTEEDYKYSFDVYSPWSNSIVGSIEYDESKCDGYCVLSDNRLLLYSEGSTKFRIYDESLDLIGTYKLSDLGDTLSYTFYAGEDENTIYTTYYNSSDLAKITLPDISKGEEEKTKKASAEMISIDTIASLTLNSQSCDSSDLILGGVDKDTLRNVVVQYDLESQESTTLAEFNSYYAGDVYENSYLLRACAYEGYWKLHQADGLDSYFYNDDYYYADLLSDGTFIFTNSVYPDEGETDSDFDTSFSATLYNADGTVKSGFKYGLGKYGSDDAYYIANQNVVFEDDQLAFYLCYNSSLEPYLLVWDLSKKGNYGDDLTLYSSYDEAEFYHLQQAHEEDPDMNSILTKVYDSTSIEWGDLSECREKADALEETYGIEIYLGEEIPDQIDVFTVGEMTDASLLMEALTTFEKILSAYPENFFTQLQYGELNALRFYFSGSLTSDTDGMLSEAGAFVTQIEQSKLMVIDCNYIWDMIYTINHEFSHMIDSRLEYADSELDDVLFSEETWATYNPTDFAYAETYSDYSSYEPYETYSEYFIDAYGTTFATEDRAEIFGQAVSYAIGDDPDYVVDMYFDDYLYEKLDYYCKCIRDGFDTTDWPEVMPWEEILSEQ